MALYTNMTSVSELDDAVKLIYDNEFIIAAEQTLSKGISSLATQQQFIEGKSNTFTVYGALTVQTSALTEDDDTREQASDSAVTITPAEYGNCVTQTRLAELQSGGRNSLALMRLQAKNMRESIDKKMILTGEAGSNTVTPGGAAEGSLTAANIITADLIRETKAKLETAGASGPFFGFIHPHVMYDLKKETGDESFVRAMHYADPNSILQDEFGEFDGIRWIRHPQVTINANAGNGNVDTYHTQIFGYNAFGYIWSEEPGGRITGPFDGLGRFVNVGWYGVYEFGLVDTTAHYVITTASSMGANT